MFAKILYPTRFEEYSLAILKSLVCLKAAGLQEIVLLHVINTEGLYLAKESGLPIDMEQIKDSAEREIAGYRDYLASEGINVRTAVAVGQPIAKIIEHAAAENVSLIVAGRQKRDILGELFVGSTTDRIIRKAQVPVLVAKYHILREIGGKVSEQFCADMFRKILYPTDWSQCAERAKQFLPALRRIGASEIVVVHVIENLPVEAELPDYFEDTLRRSVASSLRTLKESLEQEGFAVSARILKGKPHREINRVATEEDVSLIILGSHGKGFVEGILWGTVSQRVVEYSEKPVLVVK